MNIKQAFGVELKRARADAGMSQEDLAHESGVGLRYLKYLEAGAKQPTLTTICKLAAALGMPPQELVRRAWERVGGN